MAKELTLFKNFSPNLFEGIHYISNNFQSYYTWCKTGRTIKTISLDNYRINGGIASVKTTNTSEYLDYTYAIEYDTVSHTGRAFYINTARPLADYVDFTLTRDNWGTFIHQAEYDGVRISRCNRSLYQPPHSSCPGILDNLDLIKSISKSKEYLTSDTFTDYSSLSIVFYLIIALNGEWSLFNNEKSTWIQGFEYQINSNDVATGQAPNSMHILKKAVDRIASVYKINLPDFVDVDCKVIGMYILPRHWISNRLTITNFKLKTSYGDLSTNIYGISPYTDKAYINNITSNWLYKKGYGTKNRELIIPTMNQPQSVEFELNVSFDSIKFLVRSGDETLDITDSFKVNTGLNSGNHDVLGGISNSISSIGRLALAGAGIGTALAGGGLLASSTALATGNLLASNVNSAFSSVQDINRKQNLNYVPYGDAFDTYLDETLIGDYKFNTPFRCNYHEYASNSLGLINNTGLKYDSMWIADLKDVFIFPLVDSTFGTTYIKGDANIKNLQVDASTDIINKLRTGILLERTT